jgi:phospholipid/cholesterol/gamma-HCH transport system ATP-binding protein
VTPATNATAAPAAVTPLPLQISALSKCFGTQRVLDGVDVQVAAGEIVALLGRSGTGKSVLLKLIVGLQRADSGSIRIDGVEICGIGEGPLNQLRRRMGFLFQSAALYDAMTIEENVAFPLRRHTRLSDTARHAKVRELLASVGMEKELAKMPNQVSGGMQKRVGLARALALDPELLLFDEPTTGLDPITSGEIGELILSLQRQRQVAAIVVTHDVPLARRIADRLLLLREGRIVGEGTYAELQRGADPFVVEFLQPTP